MNLIEVNMNIIAAPQGYYIAHAVSSDCNFRIGLPSVIDKVFDLGERIEVIKSLEGEEITEPGTCLQLGNLFTLFVKESSYDAPDVESLGIALLSMRELMEEDDVTKLAMPKICSGRNGLDWDFVLEMIKDVFADTDIDILICVQ